MCCVVNYCFFCCWLRVSYRDIGERELCWLAARRFFLVFVVRSWLDKYGCVIFKWVWVRFYMLVLMYVGWFIKWCLGEFYFLLPWFDGGSIVYSITVCDLKQSKKKLKPWANEIKITSTWNNLRTLKETTKVNKK